MLQTETQQQEQHMKHCYSSKGFGGNNGNNKEKDVPDYPLFSKEWEWEECCHHTIE